MGAEVSPLHAAAPPAQALLKPRSKSSLCYCRPQLHYAERCQQIFSKKGQSLVLFSLVWPNPEHYFQSHWQAYEMAAQAEEKMLREHFHKPIILSAASLYEDLRQNKKAVSWHLPCGFTEKPTFPPPSLLENLTFHLRTEVVTEVFLHGGKQQQQAPTLADK